MRLSLDEIFPAAPPHTKREIKRVRTGNHRDNPVSRGEATGMSARTADNLKTRWAAVYALELRGINQKDIATALGLSAATVSAITNDERYIEYREKRMNELDAEFVMMKPLAFAALKSGLGSRDENTALRASEQWFKGAGFGGFAKDPTPQTHLTAEDVAVQLLQVNVQVNVTTPEGGATTSIRGQTTPSHTTIDAE